MQDDAGRGGGLADGGGVGGGGLQDAGGHGRGGQLVVGQQFGELSRLGGGHADLVGGGRGDDAVDRALSEDSAPPDHQEMVGGLGHLAHEVGGDEDGAALVGQTAAGLAHPDDALGVQAVDGLVEQEGLRVSQEGRCHAQALAHSQGEALDALLGHVRQSGDLQDLVHPLDRDAVGDGQLPEVGAGRARAVQTLGIQQGADLAQRRRQLPVGAAIDLDRSRRRLVQPHDHAHGGGLPGAVGAEEAGDGAGLDGEGNVVDGDLVAVLFGQVDGLNHGESLFLRA